jgi:hypothetical protein
MTANSETKGIRVWADFNGLFRGGQVLCLSHRDTSVGEDGKEVVLRQGMVVTAFMEDLDENGNRDDLIASGTVEPPPDWLRCRGSKWVLIVDENGVRHESDVTDDDHVDPAAIS